jgi:thiamine-monophosphate kinase
MVAPLPAWPHPPGATVAEIGEHAIIAWIAAAAPLTSRADVIIGVGDDAAVVQPARNMVEVSTTDIQVEDVHFSWAHGTPETTGARALHVNLSDVAAMGAEPRHALLSLGLPATMPGTRLFGVLSGFIEAARAAGVALIGGNIARAPVLIIDVTLTGTAKPRKFLRRAGARAGDEVYMSGQAGAAAAGLAWLERREAGDDPGDAAIHGAVRRFLAPEARVALGVQVGRNRAASACIDTSDGLADALQQIAQAAGVGIDLEQETVPVHPAVGIVAARWSLDPWTLALGGGEDYELVFTVPKRARRRFLHAVRRSGLPPVTRIGQCVKTPGVRLLDVHGAVRPMPAGFEHFAAPGPNH